MQQTFGPVYEVDYDVKRAAVVEFDRWLGGHIEKMLDLPGITHVRTFVAEDVAAGARRITQYYFENETELERYRAGPAAATQQAVDEQFAGQVERTARVLRETEVIDGALRPAQVCLNCGSALVGQYCGNCGQRANSRLISIWALVREAFGDLFEFDSRLWRTLVPLMVRPGRLTSEYLSGRRARFMPPFRTYLVLSIFFFLVAFFDPREELSILFTPAETAPAETTPAETASGQPSAENPERQGEPETGNATADADEGAGLNISINGGTAAVSDDCQDIQVEDMPEWMASRLTNERLRIACERVTADDGRAYVSKLLDSVPAALFILLPLMALVLKLLYPLSKRYYVEHLLFVVHFHAFVFLILTLQILASRAAGLLAGFAAVTAVTATAVAVYIPIYLYKAQRRVYRQGHFFTTLKFLVLLLSYFFGLSFIFVLTAVFAAFSM